MYFARTQHDAREDMAIMLVPRLLTTSCWKVCDFNQGCQNRYFTSGRKGIAKSGLVKIAIKIE